MACYEVNSHMVDPYTFETVLRKPISRQIFAQIARDFGVPSAFVDIHGPIILFWDNSKLGLALPAPWIKWSARNEKVVPYEGLQALV
jgi:hypothetical protein